VLECRPAEVVERVSIMEDALPGSALGRLGSKGVAGGV
jgi:hypothetical protein